MSSKLPRRVDQHWNRVGVLRLHVANVADKAGVAHVGTIGANTDNAIGRGDVDAGKGTQCCIFASGGEFSQRGIADGCVMVPSAVLERCLAVGRVVTTDRVVLER